MSLDFTLYIEVDTGGKDLYEVEIFSSNYTHNVIPLWDKAGVYDALYRSHGMRAGDVMDDLMSGYLGMKSSPELYKELDSPNGWGEYVSALPFLKSVLDACLEHRKAKIYISK